MSKKIEKEQVENKPKKTEFHSIFKKSMYDYGMYVLEDRAIPRITDGLLTSERRIVFGMFEDGNRHDKAFKKAAKGVGLIAGNLHPHSPDSLYGTMVKLSQKWKMSATLTEAHGANGSKFGDGHAAMRYVEMRLSKVASLFTDDIKYDTVEMVDNYDGTIKEPVELPTRIPNLLINGCTGIAVGFASNFPTHNYHDTIRACIEFNRNRNMSLEEMIEIIKAPDFPTGGTINGTENVIKAYKTGKGSCTIRGVVEKSEDSKGYPILDTVVLPPSIVNSKYIENINSLIENGQIKVKEKVSDLSAKEQTRIRLILRKDEDVDRVENLLYKKAGLQGSETMTLFALVNGVPQVVTLYDLIAEFIKFRERVVYRRSRFQLGKAQDDLHIQKGLRIAYENLDDVIKVIRKAETDKAASENLIKKFKLTEKQASYILELKLRRLTSLEMDLVDKKIKTLEKEIDTLTKITASRSNSIITNIIELEFKEALGFIPDTGRHCQITEDKIDISVLDSIKDETRTLVLTRKGRLKNMDVKMESQGRAGSGSSPFIAQDDDEPEIILPSSTTSTVLAFTNQGRVYAFNPYKMEVVTKFNRGKLAKTELGLKDNELIICMQSVPKDSDPKDKYLVFVTKDGLIKATDYSEYTNIQANGKRAIKLNKDDNLVSVFLWNSKVESDIVISTRNGYSIRFGLSNLNITGRDSTGVIAMKFKDKTDVVVSSSIIKGDVIYFINEVGLIKKVSEDEFPKQSRGGYGVLSGEKLVSTISDNKELHNISVFTKLGMTITIEKSSIRKVSRTATGVKAIKLNNGDKVLKIFES
ncbi:MAG: DNA gyrase subunit A [Paraclostridium sp.]